MQVPHFVVALRRASTTPLSNLVKCANTAASPLSRINGCYRYLVGAGRSPNLSTATSTGGRCRGYSSWNRTELPTDLYSSHHKGRSTSVFKVHSTTLQPRTTLRYCSYQRNMCRATEMGVSAEGDGSAMKVSGGRDVLPTNVKPTHYDLTLEPNFETFEFRGEVVIK